MIPDTPHQCPECTGTGEGYTPQQPCARCGAFLTFERSYPAKWQPDLSDEDRYVVAHHPYHMSRHERRQRAKDLRRKDGKKRNVRS